MVTYMTSQEEWVRILGKGMITIPKAWRVELGLKEGEMVKAKKEKNRVVIESVQKKPPYRVYSQKELTEFIRSDRLTKKEALSVNEKLARLSR